ncbi:protein kinase [bacterium]|nr:protein kinase [bacterium]
MTATCKKCGKSLVNTRAGSFTSYLFQQNYCQCNKSKSGRQSKASDPGRGCGQSKSADKPRSVAPSRQNEPSVSQVCTRCGKSVAKKRAGSFTSFLFQELRCQCAQPALPKKERLARTNTQVRRQVIAEKRGYTANLKANAESGRKLPQADFLPGTVVGGVFKIDAVIGEGGMGIVYLAQHLSLNRQYALKVLSPSIVSEQSWLRFKAEAKTLSVLNHPGLVKVYDLGIHENTVPYYSMDYLEGETLEDLLVRKGPQKLEFTISIFLAVLDALAYAHRNNVVHRDIKPANIFICRNQEIKILDFGISKLVGDKHSQRNQELTAIGEVFGSPYYMSPEQCRGEQIDFRSDIYSAGCTLFEAVTGYVPFESANSLEIAMLHEEGDIPLLSDVCDIAFPSSLNVVFAKCLAKLPQDRYQSAKEMAIDLTRIKEGKSLDAYAGAARRISFDSSDGKPPFMSRPAVAVASVCLLLAAGLATWINSSVLVGPDEGLRGYLQRDALRHKPVEPSSRATVSSSLSDTETNQTDASLSYAASILSVRDKSTVEAYLKTAPKFYSVAINANGRKLKGFDFPKHFSLGDLEMVVEKQSNSFKAQGRISVPLNAKLYLGAGQCVTEYPELLSRFRPAELHSLYLGQKPANSEQMLETVSRLTSLESLTLSEILVNSENQKYLDCLKKLNSLTLLNCSCSPNSLSKLSQFAQLKKIAVYGSSANFYTQVIQAIGHNSHLKTLRLGGAGLTPSEIKTIAAISSLESLSLRGSSVDNSDLKVLTALRNLQILDLSSTAVDEKSIDSLMKFPKLKMLSVSGFSSMGLKRLTHASPQLAVRISGAPASGSFLPDLEGK